MSNVKLSKILYDRHQRKYYNEFINIKDVHCSVLAQYINILKEENEDAEVLHLLLKDEKYEDGTTYVSHALNEINDDRVVVHIIDPKSFYNFPECKKIFMYFEINEKLQKILSKVGGLVEQMDNKEDYILTAVQSLNAVTVSVSPEEKDKNKKGA